VPKYRGEADRGVGRYRPRLVSPQNVADAGRRHPQRPRQRVRRQADRLHEFFAQNFAGLGSDAGHCLKDLSGVIDDFDQLGAAGDATEV
jgi:hypothetical protein